MKTKNKKPSFWGIVFGALNEAIKTYRTRLEEQRNKHKLLTSHSDWTMIETFVQQCNKNPDLKVSIRLLDGTTINLCTYKKEKVSIDQMLNYVVVEE